MCFGRFDYVGDYVFVCGFVGGGEFFVIVGGEFGGFFFGIFGGGDFVFEEYVDCVVGVYDGDFGVGLCVDEVSVYVF